MAKLKAKSKLFHNKTKATIIFFFSKYIKVGNCWFFFSDSTFNDFPRSEVSSSSQSCSLLICSSSVSSDKLFFSESAPGEPPWPTEFNFFISSTLSWEVKNRIMNTYFLLATILTKKNKNYKQFCQTNQIFFELGVDYSFSCVVYSSEKLLKFL